VDKVFDSAEEAVADVPDGASVSIAGFGITHRFPATLITALRDRGARGLTVYCNGLGQPGQPTAQMLAENKQIARLVASFSARPGPATAAEAQIAAGEVKLELVPQGTLVERMRAGGAGIPAFFTPAGAGTAIADGKEVRYFGGRPHILERGIQTDYALLRGYRADRMGNVAFRGASRNFNDSFAKAARVAIIEVEEIVDTGGLAPEEIDMPGVFVSRVVLTTIHVDPATMPRRAGRGADTGRSYSGKQALSRAEIGRRVAALFRTGQVVNLGAGLPTQAANFLHGKGVILHGENGVLNYGGFVTDGPPDPDLHDAGGNFITLNPGASFFDSVTSFEIARSGRLDAVVLGAYQVDELGDLANYAHPGMVGGGIGGAMDLAVGARQVVVMMEHQDSQGRPKLVTRCDYPLTSPGCVDTVVTDLALLRREEEGFRLDEIAAGFAVDEVLALTGMGVRIAPHVGVLQESW
jgi:3-oxoacid CoA-transferase